MQQQTPKTLLSKARVCTESGERLKVCPTGMQATGILKWSVHQNEVPLSTFSANHRAESDQVQWHY